MKNFDFTPVMAQDSPKIIRSCALMAVPLLALALALGSREFAVSLLRGVVLGLLDLVIMFAGIRKALPYAAEPQLGLKIMRRYKLYRFLSAVTIFLLMLRLKNYVAGLCIGFLLIHILLIFNLIFIAYRLNKKET